MCDYPCACFDNYIEWLQNEESDAYERALRFRSEANRREARAIAETISRVLTKTAEMRCERPCSGPKVVQLPKKKEGWLKRLRRLLLD